MDKITLCGIECRAIIGTRKSERERRQKLVVDLEMSLDLSHAGANDRLDATVDYSDVESEVVALAENTRFFLIETLASAIGNAVLRRERVESCRVRIFKEAGSRFGRGVAVEMNFKRP